jgi:hypothetical protein
MRKGMKINGLEASELRIRISIVICVAKASEDQGGVKGKMKGAIPDFRVAMNAERTGLARGGLWCYSLRSFGANCGGGDETCRRKNRQNLNWWTETGKG